MDVAGPEMPGSAVRVDFLFIEQILSIYSGKPKNDMLQPWALVFLPPDLSLLIPLMNGLCYQYNSYQLFIMEYISMVLYYRESIILKVHINQDNGLVQICLQFEVILQPREARLNLNFEFQGTYAKTMQRMESSLCWSQVRFL